MQADTDKRSREVTALFERILIEVVPGVDPRAIEPICELADIGASSLQLMEVLAEMEEVVKIRLREADLMNLRTVADVVSLVERHVDHPRRLSNTG